MLDKQELIKRRREWLKEFHLEKEDFNEDIFNIELAIDWVNQQDLPRNVLDGNIVRDAAIQLKKLMEDTGFTPYEIRERSGMNTPTTESILDEGNVTGKKYDQIGRWIREDK